MISIQREKNETPGRKISVKHSCQTESQSKAYSPHQDDLPVARVDEIEILAEERSTDLITQGEKGSLKELESIYLKQISSCPRLDRDQELEIMKKIEHHRALWRMTVLSSPKGLRKAADILKKIQIEELSLHSTLDFKGEEDVKMAKKKAEDELGSSLDEVYSILQEIELLQQKPQQDSIKPLIQKGVERIERFRIDIDFFRPWMNEMHEDAERWLNLKNELRDGISEPEVIKEALKQLENEYGEQARDFAERLCASRYHWSQYRDAKNQMTSSNLRLVVSVAKKFRHRGLPFLDLIQEGSKGVMKAADAFEWRKGYKFSTYATWWIRQYISRAVQLQPRVIHVPLNAQQSFSSIARSEEAFIQKHHRPPSEEELATVLQTTQEEVRRLIKARRHSTSLNIPINDGGEELGDALPSNDMENDFHESDMKGKIEAALDTLTFREREIIKLRYGIADGFVYTLEEVGKIFKVTRERIRQIEEIAVRKLKHPSRSRFFQDLNVSDKT